MVLGVWENWESMNVGDSFLVALIAILIVFMALIIIIFISYLFQLGIIKIEAKNHILPREENAILDEDEDAAVAAVVASIDFYKETGHEPRIISIKRSED